MPLAELMQAIEQEAAAELHTLVDAARAAASRVESDATRDLAERAHRATDQRGAAYQLAADARIAAAQRAARGLVLVARAAMLERVLAAIRTRLPVVAPAAMTALTRAAVNCAGGRPGATQNVATGVVIELVNGTRIIATLDALLDREWPRLAATALALAEAA